MSKPVLLGIDIDGVFNIVDIGTDNNLSETAIHYLNRILEVVPNCEVLIISSWKNHNGKTVKKFIDCGFKYPEKIVGVTGHCFGNHSRTKEILEWLKITEKEEYYENIVHIDDELSLYSHSPIGASKRDVVETRPDIGLNIDKAYEVICRLQGINLRFWS